LPRIINKNLYGYGDKRSRQKKRRRIQNICMKKNLYRKKRMKNKHQQMREERRLEREMRMGSGKKTYRSWN